MRAAVLSGISYGIGAFGRRSLTVNSRIDVVRGAQIHIVRFRRDFHGDVVKSALRDRTGPVAM